MNRKWIAGVALAALMVPLAASVDFGGAGEQEAEAATTSFRFVVMGDSRGSTDGINTSTLRGLLSDVKGLSTQPSFVLFTGDQVQGGSDVATELSEWKGIVDDYYPLTTYYPSLGNHEHDETIFSNAFTHLPSNQLSGYQRTSYYFDFGNSRFITLNSDRKDSNGKYIVDATQRQWLESVLANNGKTHNFVMFHVPAYPIGSHYGNSLDGNPAQRDALWNILDKYNVTSVLVGHEHNYNRRLINSSFNGNGHTFDRGIYQLTLGGAGAPLTSTVRDSRGVTVGPKGAYHYMIVDVADGLATFKVVDINGNQIDSFSVNKSATAPSTTTKSFQNGVYPTSSYSGNIDTHLSENEATTNFGTASTLLIDGDDPSGSYRDKSTLLKWDVSAVPAGSTVTSASITLNVKNVGGTYSLYQLKRNWSESAATWNVAASGTSWATAGAKGSTDRGTSALGSINVSSTGKATINLNAAGIAVVQSWVNNPSSNYGVIMADSASTNGLDVDASEASTATNRPQLNVTYSN